MCIVTPKTEKKPPYLQISMPQSGSPELLYRFHRAVDEIGSVVGPYDYAGRYKNGLTKQPKWIYQAYRKKAYAVMDLLLPYMSGPKRAKYETLARGGDTQQ